jgi:hypothetical protein
MVDGKDLRGESPVAAALGIPIDAAAKLAAGPEPATDQCILATLRLKGATPYRFGVHRQQTSSSRAVYHTAHRLITSNLNVDSRKIFLDSISPFGTFAIDSWALIEGKGVVGIGNHKTNR